MPSAADVDGADDRTQLAWQRTVLAVAMLALLIAGFGLRRHEVALSSPIGVLGLLAALALRRRPDPRRVALATSALALGAALCVVLA